MRTSTHANSKRLSLRNARLLLRKTLLSYIKEGDYALKASKKTVVLNTTATRIKKASATPDEADLEKLLNPEDYHSGRHHILSSSGERISSHRTLQAAYQGLTADNDTKAAVHSFITGDRITNYATGLLSADTIRAF